MIESGARVVARLVPGDGPQTRLLPDSLRILKARGSMAILDGDFARDLAAVIESHREPLDPPSRD